MVSHRKLAVLLTASMLLGIGFTTGVEAQEKSKSEETKSPAAKTVSRKQLESWVNQLGEGNFRERRTASNNLLKAGKQAIPVLVKGAERNDAELGARCVDIITKMFKGKEESLKSAAEKALGELEKNSNMSVAQRAQNATKKPEDIRQNPFGNLQIQLNGRAINVFQRANIVANGNWSKKISENGKTTSIEKKNGAISIEVTETVKGKLQTKKYKAKNETELKKKHPDLYKLYKKYDRLQNAGNLVFVNPMKLNKRNIILGGLPAGGAWQMRQQIVNGKRTTTVNENGKKITLEDRNDRDIVVKITETIKGKERTKTYKAKDIKDLKKKHPDIAKLYEKHTKRNNANAVFGGLQWQAMPIQIQRGAGGGGIFLPAQRILTPNEAKIKAAEKKLNESLKKLNEMAKGDKIDAKEFKSLNSQIQKLRSELKELKK